MVHKYNSVNTISGISEDTKLNKMDVPTMVTSCGADDKTFPDIHRSPVTLSISV